jgi:hypothetical protein
LTRLSTRSVPKKLPLEVKHEGGSSLGFEVPFDIPAGGSRPRSPARFTPIAGHLFHFIAVR